MAEDFNALSLSENPDAVIVVSASGDVLAWNAAAQHIFGHSADEAVGRPLSALITTPEQAEELRRGFDNARRHGLSVAEAVRSRKDGALLHVSVSCKAVLDEAGALRCFLLTMKDVSHLKVLRDAKLVGSKYGDLLESTPDAIVMVNVSGRIVLVNSQAEQVFGYARAELIGQPIEILLPARYRALHFGHRGGFFGQPRTRTMGAGLELYGQRRNGEEFPVEISLGPLNTDAGPMVMSAVRDITDRQEARRKADRKFRDLLESAPDAMVIVNEQGEIVLVNSQAVQLFGWRREEMLGQSIEILVPPRFRPAHSKHRTVFGAHPKTRSMGAGRELNGLHKDGQEFPVEISLSPIQTEDGLLIASAIRDATERKRIEKTLQEANRLKSEFLANMSHELRTPLNGILGFSELLVDERLGKLNDKQKEYIADILGCGRHLLQLINDVLDLSKVEAGKMELHPQPFLPARAVEDICTVLGPLAYKKRIQVQRNVSAAVGEVTLDLQKFKQVLFNLLSNAVKFTPEGGHVSVHIERVEGPALSLQVVDSGIGIHARDMDRLFVEFQQLDSGEARQYEGTGLGLALTRKIVELQGGRISVQSEPGRGSTFSVSLPLHETVSQQTLPA
ncbi:PAS domain S-box protein [Caldimonas brevitalea]|uniref:Virulence sensor protein BvgS n=1 Tax=Caldimonas brevitalea TaxID=413882 RepID=A0A0G3BBH5_9BURK|nr:PAS domain S-box protein [Caldimonas brevitalea]AKJ26719.1 histidine kinase [Caldimonas brevitalea]